MAESRERGFVCSSTKVGTFLFVIFLFNQLDPIEVGNLFFKGYLAKVAA